MISSFESVDAFETFAVPSERGGKGCVSRPSCEDSPATHPHRDADSNSANVVETAILVRTSMIERWLTPRGRTNYEH
jgi:hypothetical protein